jgi:hypothetical protein
MLRRPRRQIKGIEFMNATKYRLTGNQANKDDCEQFHCPSLLHQRHRLCCGEMRNEIPKNPTEMRLS